MKLDNGELVNATKILEWVEPMMGNYCQVFRVSCNDSGCGIDDQCSPDQVLCPHTMLN